MTYDPHRNNPDVHYRLYLSKDRGPVVICVQDFDYPDYDETRFLSSEAWASEEGAERELTFLKMAVEVLRHNPQGAAAIYLHVLREGVS